MQQSVKEKAKEEGKKKNFKKRGIVLWRNGAKERKSQEEEEQM